MQRVMAVYLIFLLFALVYVSFGPIISPPVGVPIRAIPEIKCIPETEVCNEVDDDCDGRIDEGDVCVEEVTVRKKINFSSTELSFDKREGFDEIKLVDSLYTEEVGEPMLPFRNYHIALPYGMEVESVEITAKEFQLLPGSYNVFPAQIKQKTLADEPIPGFVNPKKETYRSREEYPGKLIELVEEGSFGGYNVLNISLFPVQFIPGKKKIVFYNEIEFSLRLKETEKTALTPNRSEGNQAMFKELVKGLVINPIELEGPSTGGKGGDGIDYLIITSPSLASSFQELANWKKQKGLSVKIITTDFIEANYSGVDLPEKMRNCIIDYYTNYGTLWVLLGGDEDNVPIRYCYYSDTTTPPSVYDLQICDVYFSDLDGVWDLDGDGVYGEPNQDNPNIYPEVFVGRIPATGTQDVINFTEKLLNYEQNPGMGERDYLTRATYFSSDQMRDYEEVGQHNLIATHIGSNIEQDLTSLIETPYGSAPDPVSPDGLTGISMLNEGYGIVNVLAHGIPAGFKTKSNGTNGDPTSWIRCCSGGSGEENGYILNLTNTNNYGILYSISCSQATIDNDDIYGSSDPCIAQNYVNLQDKGGVAFLGNSRWGWVAISYKLTQEFYGYLFTQPNGFHVGVAEAMSKTVYPWYRDIDYGHILLGDPEMPVWTETPKTFNVIQNVSGSNFIVEVYDEGIPVENVRVSICTEDYSCTTEFTDSSGEALFSLPFTEPFSLITVTKHNFIPFQATINLESCSDGTPLGECNSETSKVCVNGELYLLGELNYNGKIDGGDIIILINYLYRYEPFPEGIPLEAGDAYFNGAVNSGDIVYLIDYLYRNGPAPCQEPLEGFTPTPQGDYTLEQINELLEQYQNEAS